ncbi:DUF4376 domain-containing protein [Ramlibacter sp. Leaf400]|uniref:DUF4376 domain-containing protein n=1 Tax=Ramlibacter sp. Leaf400 TaxID=1736365 RepID=UPI0006F9E4A2|nr:DUF4376 domain-containing protein [Ramlibacter sp. Leaf400]KQT10956.1 hypothetical protein ASG30_09160 [Ramlibacter sp. Leaf400]
MYRLTEAGDAVVRLADGARIPLPPTEREGFRYQRWLDEGNAPGLAPVPTREQAIAAAWDSIKAERDRRTLQGGYQAGGKWFHSDTFSRTQQIGLLLLGANVPPGTQWKTMDGSFITMTQTMAGQIFSAAAASDIAIFTVAETHRAAMVASEDPAAYDFTSGWPVVFGEEA